jgi:prepilin-type N-terminal cleavage/methylation domain-containing protein
MPRPGRGVTLVELLVVIAIIAILLSLLFPAILAARSASHKAACESNIRQIALGIHFYMDAHRGFFPLPPNDQRPSGWAITILPFIEEGALANLFDYTQPPTSPHNLKVARNRPNLYYCPVTPEVDSTLAGVGVCNYVIVVDDVKRNYLWHARPWDIKDAAEGSRFPWSTSKEILWKDSGYPPPHPSAYSIFDQ